MYTLYGISNCSTVKKAKDWLTANNIDYQFHDYRKQELTTALLNALEGKSSWEELLNKRSASWRKLSEEQQANISKQTALQYMLESPTLIKRPILDIDTKLIIGFTDENYQKEL